MGGRGATSGKDKDTRKCAQKHSTRRTKKATRPGALRRAAIPRRPQGTAARAAEGRGARERVRASSSRMH